MKLCLFSVVFALSLCTLHAEEIDVTQPLRIQQLMPRDGMFVSLGIDPAVPKDFVAMNDKGTIDYSDWVYWGPEKVLKAYFEDPTSLAEPIMRAQLSTEVAQRRFGSLDEQSL